MRRRVIVLLAAVLCALSPTFSALYASAPADSTLLGRVFSRLWFGGYAQLGWEYHDQSSPSNEFAINKLILMSNVRITDQLNAFGMFDFKGFTLHELWVDYAPCPWVHVKAGQFKTPFTLENPISPAVMEMITQMSLAGTYMIAGGSPYMMPGSAGRDIGVTVYGSLGGGRLSYDLAVMNGAGRNRRDNNSQKDFVARLSVRPLGALTVGGSAVVGTGHIDPEEPPLPGLRADGNFRRQRYAASAQWQDSHLTLRGEYLWGRDADARSDGGYVTALVANIGVRGLDAVGSVDHLRAIEATVNRWQLGLQYWFYPKCRVQAAYSRTHFCRGKSENAILTQVQVAF